MKKRVRKRKCNRKANATVTSVRSANESSVRVGNNPICEYISPRSQRNRNIEIQPVGREYREYYPGSFVEIESEAEIS